MVEEVKYWHLRDHQLFSLLTNAQIEDLCIITRYKKAYKNEVIYFANESIKRIYFLKKGMIKIAEYDQDDKEITKDILQQGDLFGELSLDNEHSTSGEFAQAMSDEVIICTFLLTDFEKVLQQNPSVAISFTKLVGLKLKQLESRYNNLVFKDVKTRLQIFLNDWATKEGVKEGNNIAIQNYLTQQEIANLVCSTRQTVTQLLNDLQNEGKISYTRKKIVLHHKQ